MSKMWAKTVAGLLNTEITVLPKILSQYFGKFYSNTLCNACTWLFIIWYVLHAGLDYALNELFRKMRYQEYNRIRLKHSLWYLGFYGTAFAYTGAVLFQNHVDVFALKKTIFGRTDINLDLVIGFLVLFTFFLHSAFWEVLEYDSLSGFVSYILLCLVFLVAFFLRVVEVVFALTAFVSITRIALDSTKLLFVVTKQDSAYLRIVVSIFFGLSVSSFCLSYLIGVPLVFLLPVAKKIQSELLPVGYVLFAFALVGWYISEINNSPLYKLIGHCLFHTEKSTECQGDLMECSLFPPRDDAAFNLCQLRKEMKEREELLLASRKQNRKGALMQTIRCMMTLKRKMRSRRSSKDNTPEKEGDDIPLVDANGEAERLIDNGKEENEKTENRDESDDLSLENVQEQTSF